MRTMPRTRTVANTPFARSKRRWFFGLLLLGAASIIPLILLSRTRHDRPERVLTDLGNANCVAIRRDRAWFIQTNPPLGKTLLQFIDLHDGCRYTAGALPSDDELRPGETLEDRPHSIGDSLFFVIYLRSTYSVSGRGGGFLPAVPRSAAKRAVIRRIVRLPSPPKATEDSLYRISLTDGRAERIALDTEGFSLRGLTHAFTTTALYWIRPRGGSMTQFERGGGIIEYDYPANQDLMITPLNGGPPRRLAGSLTAISSLWADNDGICWTTPRPFPDERCDLYILLKDRPDVPILVPDFDPSSQPILSGGHCYWIHTALPESG